MNISLPAPAQATAVTWVLGGPEENSRIIEADLRQAGHAMRVGWIADLDELGDALGRGQPDLLFCFEFLPGDLLRQALELCTQLAPGLPVLSLGPSASPSATLEVLTLGAGDRVTLEDDHALEHLDRVYRRESQRGRLARELQRLQPRLAAFEAQHREQLRLDVNAAVQARKGLVTLVNEAFAELTGEPEPAGLIGRPLIDLIAAEQRPRVKEELRQFMRGHRANRVLDTALLHASGASLPVRLQLALGSLDSEEFVEWRVVSESPLKAERAMPGDRLALFRHLGVPAADARPRAALLLVVDGFAALEASLGLEDAERLVGHVGSAIAALLGNTDTLFRFSNDEWLAILHRDSVSDIEQIAERLCRDLAAPLYTAGSHQTRITLTVCAYPIGLKENAVAIVEPLVREARRLSTEAPGQMNMLGQTARDNAEARDLAARGDQLRGALEHNRLRLAYQSIASLEGDARMHADVLVRMVDEHNRELHASEFLPTAEKLELMAQIDRWVVGHALSVLSKREINPLPALLMLRLSAETLREADAFLEWLPAALGPRKLLHRELCFTLQESVVQGQLGKAAELAKALDELGAGFALDHYGLGAQSIPLLDELPLRFVRFAPQLTRLFGEPSMQQRMTDLIRAAKQRGIKTIVSHVEDANLMARMWQMGVDYIQGYYIQEPDVVLLATDAVRR